MLSYSNDSSATRQPKTKKRMYDNQKRKKKESAPYKQDRHRHTTTTVLRWTSSFYLHLTRKQKKDKKRSQDLCNASHFWLVVTFSSVSNCKILLENSVRLASRTVKGSNWLTFTFHKRQTDVVQNWYLAHRFLMGCAFFFASHLFVLPPPNYSPSCQQSDRKSKREKISSMRRSFSFFFFPFLFLFRLTLL